MGWLLAVSHRLHALRAALIVLPGSALRSTDWWLPRVLICISGTRLAVSAPPTLLPSSLTAVSVRSRSMIASREATSRRRPWIPRRCRWNKIRTVLRVRRRTPEETRKESGSAYRTASITETTVALMPATQNTNGK